MNWQRVRVALTRSVGVWPLLLMFGVSLFCLWLLRPLDQTYLFNSGHDFLLLYAAAHAVRDHQNPYESAVLLHYAQLAGLRLSYLIDGSHHLNQPYVYPPLFAWLASPLTFMRPTRALFVWRIICAAGVFAGTYALTAPWRGEVNLLRTRGRRVMFAILSVMAPVTVYGLYWGNPVELVYAAMCGCVWLLCRRRKWTDVAAGALMSVSLLKPQFALPLAVLSAACFVAGDDMWTRLRHVGLGFISACLGLLTLDLLTTGPGLLAAWPRSILYLARMTNTQPDMPSLLGLLRGYLLRLSVRRYSLVTLAIVVVTAVAIVALYWWLRGRVGPTALFALLSVMWCFGSPYGHANDDILLVPGALALLAVIQRLGGSWLRPLALSRRMRVLVLRLACDGLLVGLALFSIALLYAGGVLPFLHYHAHRLPNNIAIALAPCALLLTQGLALGYSWAVRFASTRPQRAAGETSATPGSEPVEAASRSR